MATLDRVFVTGATGFLGSHLVDSLTERGTGISALVRAEGGLACRKPHLRVVRGDLGHPFTIDDAATVFHLAAISHVGRSLEDPRGTFETNTAGTLTVLEAVRRSGSVEKLVFVSTAHVYGTPQYVPIDEAHPLHAQEPYAASKVAAEAFVSAYSNTYGIPAAIGRLFNVYGPGQHSDFVIPSIIKQAVTQDAITLGNLTPTRDFTYVDDVINALLRLAEAGDGIYNIGSGVEVSVETLVTCVARILDKRVAVVSNLAYQRPKDVEIDRMWADISRITALGWHPRVKLIDGLRRTIKSDWQPD